MIGNDDLMDDGIFLSFVIGEMEIAQVNLKYYAVRPAVESKSVVRRRYTNPIYPDS